MNKSNTTGYDNFLKQDGPAPFHLLLLTAKIATMRNSYISSTLSITYITPFGIWQQLQDKVWNDDQFIFYKAPPNLSRNFHCRYTLWFSNKIVRDSPSQQYSNVHSMFTSYFPSEKARNSSSLADIVRKSYKLMASKVFIRFLPRTAPFCIQLYLERDNLNDKPAAPLYLV